MTTDSRSGLSVTVATDVQLRVCHVRHLVAHGGTKGSRHNPLGYFPAAVRTKFINSLKFGPRGLASFNDTSFEEASLTATEAFQILALFGVQSVTTAIPGLLVDTPLDRKIFDQPRLLEDYRDYECRPPATCTPKLDDICLGNLCGAPS